MKDVRVCKGCPILDKNEDTCNLGYTTRCNYPNGIESPVETWVIYSEDCKLNFIETRDGVIEPDWIEIE
jgi:hypothetical protein